MWRGVADREPDGVWSWSVQSVGLERLWKLQRRLRVRRRCLADRESDGVWRRAVLVVGMVDLCELQRRLRVRCRVAECDPAPVRTGAVQLVGVE